MSLRCCIVLDVGLQPNGDLMMLIIMQSTHSDLRRCKMKPAAKRPDHTHKHKQWASRFLWDEVETQKAGKGFWWLFFSHFLWDFQLIKLLMEHGSTSASCCLVVCSLKLSVTMWPCDHHWPGEQDHESLQRLLLKSLLLVFPTMGPN